MKSIKIISIHLSNDYETPHQIQSFISHDDYKLHQFLHLQSISISNLQCKQTLNKIITEYSNLPYLTHLTLIGCTIEMSENDKQHFYNQIWNLSKLKYCHLNIDSHTRTSSLSSAVISKSLKYLTISNNDFSLLRFADLYRHTPNLRHLSAWFVVEYNELQLLNPMYSITRLNIMFHGVGNMLEHLLKNLPNLYQLKCDLNVYINGNEWEDIIKKSLPKLNMFQVRMRYTPTNNENKENQLNEIINSYQTNFWISEHQWFIRCHWYSIDAQERFNFIDVFTVPYTYDSFEEHTLCLLAKSTVLYDNNYLQFSLPFNERFFFIVSKFDRLKTLFVYIEENKNLNNIQSQLQLILDQAHRLYSLEFSTWARSDSDAPLTGLRSNSVRRLNLIRLNFNGQIYHFDKKECIELSRSPLGIQCEVLIITVKNRKNILHLINNMKNLRSLYVHSIDHYWPKNGSVSPAMDELVQWLYEQLPSTSTVIKSQTDSFGIHIWIR
ncbi:unnamed protein product [Adineta steineri]|uniref:Uncharacterized protein n=1 Tax=Adineta steineri TaxID=433720 RepID=A0A819I2Y4_9BILA|nr:unnamed protein product [Adineta steineri]CAF3907315.1 unnamed protein product [Adineta steineri]